MLTLAQPKILMIPTNKGIEVIAVPDIIRIKAISNYSKIYFAGGKKIVLAKGLKFFEQMLPADQFIRVHRAHLVNKNSIRQYIKGKTVHIELKDGEQIAVAKRKKMFFLQSFFM